MINSSDLTLSAIGTDIKRKSADALILGVLKNGDKVSIAASPFAADTTTSLEQSLSALGVAGKADEITALPGVDGTKAKVLQFIGLGVDELADLTEEKLRRAAGSAARQLSNAKSAIFALPADSVERVAAVAEGIALGSYRYENHRSKKSEKPVLAEAQIVTSVATSKDLPAVLKRAAILGRAVRGTRDLINAPANVLYPESFAAAVKDYSKSLPLKVTIFDEKRLAKDGFGGLIGVGGGSARQPRMVKVEYAPSKAAKHIALIGKGITFDTGGTSLKPAAGMHAMKSDMSGAAAVFQTVAAVAELGLNVKVTAWLCLAENMPGGASTRPGDVLTMFGGKTVEVLNTDAEGRLVMADGLAAASLEKPDVMIDIATLTGAQMLALGLRTAGVMGDKQVTSDLVAVSDKVGELAWAMPLPEELRPSIESQVADLANIGERMGGMMTAAVFLEEFVGEVDGKKIPWAHIDFAGPAFNEGSAWGYTPKNGTGSQVRTLVAYAEQVAAAN
ncbi:MULTISPECIES: leucyl aminopeptidase [Glutamicibacter]|uniref:Probable cytosol aminopeptidase n=2 Tax=Glutamicibacter TaxID=1742989 RepID=A0ABX4MYV5_9MICC|nr:MULTISPECIES: leucyl aminopeptidase [Glutamicibacter]KWR71389.1 aminopeptidase [Arthrobacter sp. W1]MDV2976375.1 leucyl aminopeptidase [Actinomycetes bacterium ARC8]PJJ44198.1 leucyl aminopeptidase [Glutamicibacter mysorens]WIV42752.1 leucyl aminopeptidase [Glutamicibacter nicotianae]GEC13297.1 putative cytosol aminopeptidase [Glutamicibacter nicotianae]